MLTGNVSFLYFRRGVLDKENIWTNYIDILVVIHLQVRIHYHKHTELQLSSLAALLVESHTL
jgi:hypothetical protein